MIFHAARKYEDTGSQKLARDAACPHAHQSDPSEKLAREVDQSPPRHNGLVPDQKKHRDHTVAVRNVPHGASYENALKGRLINSMRRAAKLAAIFSSAFLLKHGSPFLVIENAREIPISTERV